MSERPVDTIPEDPGAAHLHAMKGLIKVTIAAREAKIAAEAKSRSESATQVDAQADGIASAVRESVIGNPSEPTAQADSLTSEGIRNAAAGSAM